jgi:hypothetical protein
MIERRSITHEILFWGVLGLMLFVGIYFLGMAVWPYTPVRVDSITPSKTKVCRGEELCFRFVGEKYYDMTTQINVELVNGEAYAVMTYASDNPKGLIEKERCFIVPYHVKPNNYHIRWTGNYHMNAFKTVRKSFLTDWVEVTSGAKGLAQGPIGPRGAIGRTGPAGQQGKKGGFSFGGTEGPQGKQGLPGKPGKSCTGDVCK